ncbi:nuclear envelope pore membrane protein POM 121 [Cheilinus undulatus]|uniref:nuclear envelope pore membrane protein POM 121 n=1 Tax=Cheilinus undulatus TaxID=241271 RepID=UPI001BD39804|nr:nuclear envelope pore membrane protein POM 121 [Cheilinus undulatus]
MRVLRRRAAAMSPREKHLAILSALGLVSLALYYSPTFLYATLILAVCCLVCYYHSGEPLPARLGLNPRAGLRVPAVLRRWLWGLGVTGVSAAARGRTKSSRNKTELREPEGPFRERFGETGIYRRESLTSDSFLFSPRDFLMGSYIGKPESPTADPGRPRPARNPREQLRERLSRPNHAVYTPNRRLSFTGEPLGTVSRFTITPQRHYPLQQPGVSSVGVLPPVRWDGFRKKNILSPRNSPAALSPVTVKIARPDHHSSPSFDHHRCAGHPRTPADPCSRESVLKVLKESRKRDVEDEDRSFTTEQKSKRRRNDSGGSAHSAFGPLLPNGTPSQLVPKPGSLKRGMTSLAEESIMKRSRTSSISSGSGVHAPRGTPGTQRNPIHSSYSSSIGLSQWKKRSAPSSPLSSPGSSRCQTPEGVSKRPREDEGQSPSSASSVRSDHTASDKAPVTSKLTPAPKVPDKTMTDSTGSGGKRKRKIQLVSSHRDDQISLPPPPELGYSITVKDLDEEKKAAISKIQKVLETPAPEPEKSASPPATTSTEPTSSTSSTSTTTLSSLLAAPLPTASSSAIPVINLDPSPSSSATAAPAAPNPLLEALKKSSTPAPVSTTPAATSTTVSASATPVQPSSLTLKVSTTENSPQPPPVSLPQSSSASGEQPSAFMQVLSQVSKPPSSTPPLTGPGLFGLASQSSTSTSSTTSNPVTTAAETPASSSESVSNTNPLLASGFKPIFAVTSTSSSTPTPESKPTVPTFKPIFGAVAGGSGFGQLSSITATNPTSTASSTSAPSLFGASTSSTTVAPSVFPGMTNTPSGSASTGSIPTTQPEAKPAVKSLFGNWSAPTTTSTSSATTQAPSTGSTFQFGAAPTTTAAAPAPAPAAATTTSSNSTFTFGATQPDAQATSQKVFAFGQPASTQNTTTATFGGFGLANAASTTTTAAAATTQSTFTFGASSFPAPAAAAQPAFGSSAAPPKPFTFGASGAAPAPAANAAPPPFPFGSTAATTAPSFGTPAQPAFGASSTGFTFGSTAAPSAAPSFGAATQTQSSSSSTFTFGSAAPQPAPSGPAQPAPSGFNFGAGMQFGAPVSNNPAPQMGGFNFGAAATDKPAFGTSTPSFGQSAAAGPIPFGSPGTPVQGFNAVPFGSPATPSFSIGAGSKPSGARQRLQARRQHNRKK